MDFVLVQKTWKAKDKRAFIAIELLSKEYWNFIYFWKRQRFFTASLIHFLWFAFLPLFCRCSVVIRDSVSTFETSTLFREVVFSSRRSCCRLSREMGLSFQTFKTHSRWNKTESIKFTLYLRLTLSLHALTRLLRSSGIQGSLINDIALDLLSPKILSQRLIELRLILAAKVC